MYNVKGTEIYINPATVVAVIKYDNIDTFFVKTSNGQLFNIPVDEFEDFQKAVDSSSGGGGGGDDPQDPFPHPDAKKLNETNENVTWLYNHRREPDEVDLSSLPQDEII